MRALPVHPAPSALIVLRGASIEVLVRSPMRKARAQAGDFRLPRLVASRVVSAGFYAARMATRAVSSCTSMACPWRSKAQRAAAARRRRISTPEELVIDRRRTTHAEMRSSSLTFTSKVARQGASSVFLCSLFSGSVVKRRFGGLKYPARPFLLVAHIRGSAVFVNKQE